MNNITKTVYFDSDDRPVVPEKENAGATISCDENGQENAVVFYGENGDPLY